MSTGSGDVTNEVQESSKTLSCGTTRQQVQASWKDEYCLVLLPAAVVFVVMRLATAS